MDELKPTSAEEIKETSTITVESPLSKHRYMIRKASGLDYLALDFLPTPDPTMSVEERKEAWTKETEADPGLEAQTQKAMCVRCCMSPKMTCDGDPSDTPKDVVHIDLIGPDIEWLFIQIDEYTRGEKSENPTMDSAD